MGIAATSDGAYSADVIATVSHPARATILTYHAIDAGPAPLWLHPDVFRKQMEVVCNSGLEVVTVAQLAERLRTRSLTSPTVTITFDDGFRSVAANAAPILLGLGLTATIFCVAGRLGARSDWRSAHADAHTAELSDAAELVRLAEQGFEIGAHGMQHEPLVGDDGAVLREEIVLSRDVLQTRVGVSVVSFAYPYGAGPSPAAARLVKETYAAACTTVLDEAGGSSDPHALPRLDAYYVRRPELLERALAGTLGSYLRWRRLGARARRLVKRDYASPRRVGQ